MRVDSLLDIEAAQNIIILGTVGQGKSMFMRHLAVNELSTSGKIPLFLELRYVSAEEGLNGLLVNAFRSMGLLNVKENQVQEILKTGKFTLFLDGIDEIKRINILKIKK
ncbi:hypothetical protein GO497_11915 [Acidovorax citrulli]|nr:hypothetical protein [Paracidovorax citrulli]